MFPSPQAKNLGVVLNFKLIAHFQFTNKFCLSRHQNIQFPCLPVNTTKTCQVQIIISHFVHLRCLPTSTIALTVHLFSTPNQINHFKTKIWSSHFYIQKPPDTSPLTQSKSQIPRLEGPQNLSPSPILLWSCLPQFLFSFILFSPSNMLITFLPQDTWTRCSFCIDCPFLRYARFTFYPPLNLYSNITLSINPFLSILFNG